jgi:serine/threonine-protein kinase
VDCAFCYYPNDEGVRFCVRCAASIGVPVEQLPSVAPPAPHESAAGADELAGAEALAAAGVGRGAAAERGPRPILGGRYRLLRCLGTGGFGAVYEAEEIDTSLRVAVKLLHRTALDDARMRERFLQEARMVAELRSPHVVRLYDYALTPALLGQHRGGVPYLVMELLSGVNLATLMMRGVLPPRRTLHILSQVAAALAEAHALGIVHRDIKPDNILLVDPLHHQAGRAAESSRSSDEVRFGSDFVKVIDFGVARLCGPATRPSDVLGTPAFISPETLANEPVDGRSDLYSLGILLWQMLVGELPFPSTNQAVMMNSHLAAPRHRPSTLFPALAGRLPSALEDLMVRLIARKPSDRPASAYEVRSDLLAVLGALPSTFDSPLDAPLPNFGPCWDPAPAEPGSVALDNKKTAVDPPSRPSGRPTDRNPWPPILG